MPRRGLVIQSNKQLVPAETKDAVIENAKPQFGNIKDELFLISFVVLCSGLVFTDAYYQRFGFRYQTLNLSTLHIIYKGLTMIFTSPLMLIPYCLTIIMIMAEFYAIQNKHRLFLSLRTPIIYLFIILNMLIIFPLAKSTGVKQAYIDMYEDTTGLPKIRLLKADEMTLQAPMDKFLLFLVDDNFVTYFSPLQKGENNVFPIIKRISKSKVTLLDTYH